MPSIADAAAAGAAEARGAALQQPQRLQGRNLDGFASRCGALAHPGAMRVQIGCGTGLADVHYHCHHCYADPGSDPGDLDLDSDQ